MKELIKKFLNKETICYLIFGVLTTVVDLIIYQAALWLGIHYLIAQGIAWVVAVAFAFITNKLFVFESKTTEKSVVLKELISFVSARIVSFQHRTVQGGLFMRVLVNAWKDKEIQ